MSASTEHWKAWGQYIAIAGAYAACYEVTRHVTFPHWILTAGLRLSCLLLVPVRYWPALALGELLPMVENALLCIPQFGTPWAISASVPMIVLCMACIKPMRARWSYYSPDGRLNKVFLLGATLACALLTAIKTSVTTLTALMDSPGAWPDIDLHLYFWAYLLGSYLGALTLTPMILALKQRFDEQGFFSMTMLTRSPLFRDTMAIVPILGMLCWYAFSTHDEVAKQLARFAMLVPVVAMTWRHGWHGGAIAGMVSSIASAATADALLDPKMIQFQVVLSLVVSASLFTAARLPNASRETLISER